MGASGTTAVAISRTRSIVLLISAVALTGSSLTRSRKRRGVARWCPARRSMPQLIQPPSTLVSPSGGEPRSRGLPLSTANAPQLIEADLRQLVDRDG